MKNLIVILLALTIFSFEIVYAGQKTSLKVDSMTCASCAGAIERELKKYPEISSVDISVSKGTVSVDFKNGKHLSHEELKKAIEKAGYKAD